MKMVLSLEYANGMETKGKVKNSFVCIIMGIHLNMGIMKQWIELKYL